MTDILEAAVEAVLSTQHIQDHLGGSIDAADVRNILAAAAPIIRAQTLREAASLMRTCKQPGHWNLLSPYCPDVSYSPDAWLEKLAERSGE